MNLECYNTFLVVAKYESYRKAANKLFITQTSVFNDIEKTGGKIVSIFEYYKAKGYNSFFK